MERVRIRMQVHAGVVGEDRTDWLGGEEHECSPHFARHLVLRGLAHIVEAPRVVTPGLTHGDPVVESRDPGMSTESAAPIVTSRRKRA